MDIIKELLAKTTSEGFMEKYSSDEITKLYLQAIENFRKVYDSIEKGGPINGVQ